jgi:hypothetical protein
MFKRTTCALAAIVILVGTALATERTAFHDALLDNLVGDWHVEREFGDGRTAENTLHAEWMLDHQFIELHYRDVATPPKYEAMVFIGYDAEEQRYVCHWIDNSPRSATARSTMKNARSSSRSITKTARSRTS